MLTIAEIQLLAQEEMRAAVAENISRDPSAVALDKRIPHAALVATQVKYLQRAKTKLPSYYSAQCIMAPLAYEQSSSERTAEHKNYAGGLCIDLTCGLGVDSFYLSKKFARVVAVERDAALAALARYNFGLLGAENIEIVNADAEEFLAAYDGPAPDLVYIDPARRSEKGRKTVTLSDSSPDVEAILPVLRRKAAVTVVKLSPLFDVDEAFRIFGKDTRVEAVSLGGECKEVLVETGGGITGQTVAATALDSFSVEYDYPVLYAADRTEGRQSPGDYSFLIASDAALVKARVVDRFYRGTNAFAGGNNSFVFADLVPDIPGGRVYRIISAMPYSPKKIRAQLMQAGVGSLNILRRDFPYSTADVAKALGIREGGSGFAAVTRFAGGLWFIVLGPA